MDGNTRLLVAASRPSYLIQSKLSLRICPRARFEGWSPAVSCGALLLAASHTCPPQADPRQVLAGLLPLARDLFETQASPWPRGRALGLLDTSRSLCPSSAAASQGLLLGAILTQRGPPPGTVGKPFLGPHAGVFITSDRQWLSEAKSHEVQIPRLQGQQGPKHGEVM